jgi:aminoglycoside phosphotransferase family enzyme/predicted kinase
MTDHTAAIVTALSTPALHGGAEVRHVQTHISHVFLAGDWAYKLKKPVNFGFLDFSTLAARKTFCEKELTANQRYAPELYDSVLPVTFDGTTYHLGGNGEVVDYVVKMHRFDEAALFDALLAKGKLDEHHLSDLTDRIAAFHAATPVVDGFWDYTAVHTFAMDNVAVLAANSALVPAADSARLRDLTEAALAANKPLIEARRRTHVKATHGDLHLRNICLLNGHAIPFDGIEFNDHFVNNDVYADIAFLIMDLLHRGHDQLATAVLNRYLKRGDDFGGLPLLALYLSYRAAVRAKVACLQHGGADAAARPALAAEAQAYTTLAIHLLDAPRQRRLIAIGGLSGSGKSTLGKELARHLGAIHIRSDAVRKHIYGTPVWERAPQEAYTPEMTDKTYHGMLARAELALTTGRPVIVDAVCARESEREALEHFAHSHGLSFTGIWCQLPADLARKRITDRRGDISDATVDVYEKQMLYDTGRITWHRLDTQHGIATVTDKALALIKLTGQPL